MNATKLDRRTVQKATRPIVIKLLALSAVAEVERERADIRHNAILATGNYQYGERGERCELTGRITECKNAWLMNDGQAEEYYRRCDEANAAAGYTLPTGHCPALIAESDVIKQQNDLIRIAAPMFGINPEHLSNMTHRTKFLELITGLALAK